MFLDDFNTSVSADVDVMVSKAAILVTNVFNKTTNNTDQKSSAFKATSKGNIFILKLVMIYDNNI